MLSRTLWILFFALSFFGMSAQDDELVINTSVSDDVTVCGDEVTFTVEVLNVVADDATNVVLEITLPTGIEYTGGLSGNTNTFNIGTLNSGDVWTTTFTARGTCALISTIQDQGGSTLVANINDISYVIDGQTISRTEESESYNVRYADLEVFVDLNDADIKTFFLDTEHERRINIQNGGLGHVDEFTFTPTVDPGLEYMGLWMKDSGGNLTLLSSTPSAVTINDFTGIGNGDNEFGQNESIELIDSVRVKECRASMETNYTVSWGCYGDICNENDQEAQFNAYVTFIGGSPSINIAQPIVAGSVDFCNGNAIVALQYTNVGTSSPLDTADVALNVRFHSSNGNVSNIVSYTVGSQTITLSGGTFDFANTFTSDPDGAGVGLEDVDGDGYFDDLPKGNTLEVQIEFTPTWPSDFSSTCGNINVRWFYRAYISYTANCATGPRVNSRVNERYYEIFGNDSFIDGPRDMVDGDSEVYTFNVSKTQESNDIISCSDGTFYSEIAAPSGYILEAANFNGDPVTFTQSGTSVTVEGGGWSGSYNLTFRLDCSQSSATSLTDDFSWNMYYRCCGSFEHQLACESYTIYNHCPQCPGFHTYSFEARRLSLGWKPPTGFHTVYRYDQLYGASATADRSDPATDNLKLHAAYPLDTIEIEALGVYNGTNTYNDSVFIDVTYNSVGATNILELIDATFTVTKAGGGVFTTTVTAPAYNFTQDLENFVGSTDPDQLNLSFPVPLSDLGGILIEEDDQIDMVARLKISNPSISRGVYPFDAFRALHYALDTVIIDGNTELTRREACESWGTNFDFYKPNVFPILNLSVNMSPIFTNVVQPIRYQSATGGDDFPNEYRPATYLLNLEFDVPEGFHIPSISQFYFRPGSGYRFFYGRSFNPPHKRPDGPVIFNDFGRYAVPEFDVNSRDLFFTATFEPDCDNGYTIPAEGVVETQTQATDLTYGKIVYQPETSEHTIEFNVPGTKTYRNLWNPTLQTSVNTLQEGYESTVTWPVQVCYEGSPGPGSIRNIVAVELNPDDESTYFIGATDLNGNALPVRFYGDATNDPVNTGRGRHMLIRLQNTGRGTCKTFNLIAQYKECFDDEIEEYNLITSWYSAFTYPNPNNQVSSSTNSIKEHIPCYTRIEENTLQLRYKTANMQWEINRDRDVADLCDPVEYTIDITSTKYASMNSVELNINLPTGLTFENNTIEYLYPEDATSWTQIVNPTLPLSIDALIGGELPGTRLPNENTISFRFNAVADCQYDPSKFIEFTLDGVTNCNDVLQFRDQRRFPIRGTQVEEIDMAMTLSATPLENCTDTNQVCLTLDNFTNPNIFIPDQTITLNLPEGTTYTDLVSPTPAPDNISADGTQISWVLTDAELQATQTFCVTTEFTITDLAEIGNPSVLTYTGSSTMLEDATCITNNSTCQLTTTTSEAALDLPIEPFVDFTLDTDGEPVCSNGFLEVTVNVAGVSDYSGYTFTWTPASGAALVEGTDNVFLLDASVSLNYSVEVSDGTCAATNSIDIETFPDTFFTFFEYGESCEGYFDGEVDFYYWGHGSGGQAWINSIQPESGVGETNTDFGYEDDIYDENTNTLNVPYPFNMYGYNNSRGYVFAVGFSPDTYTIELEDEFGCISEEVITIENEHPVINVCTTQLPCGETQGDVDVNFTVSSDNWRYTDFYPSFGSSTQYTATLALPSGDVAVQGTFNEPNVINLTGVPVGTYILTIEAEANDCSVSTTVTVESYAFTASLDPETSLELCSEDDTKDVSVVVNNNINSCTDVGDIRYRYKLSTNDGPFMPQFDPPYPIGTTTDNTRTYTGLGEGTYSVAIEVFIDGQATECKDTLEFELFVTPTLFTVEDIITEDPSCFGASDGSAEVIVYGGSGNFTYLWTTPDCDISDKDNCTVLSTGSSVNGLPAGDYVVYVWDATSCAEPDPYPFTLLEPEALATPFIQDLESCSAIAGEQGVFDNAISYTTGTPGYTFNWYLITIDSAYDANGDLIETTNSSLVFSEQVNASPYVSTYDGLSPGTYQVEVIDANGCSAISEETLIEQPAVERCYNICMNWKTRVREGTESEPSDPRTIEGVTIVASSIREALDKAVDDCIEKAQGDLEAGLEEACNNIELLDDAVCLGYTLRQQHYTLYYYDRAGRLVRTVPPEGVNLVTDRDPNTGELLRVPTNHTYITGYDYNTLSQMRHQFTPDGGESNFLYNNLGQLRYSQNARQAGDGSYSYTIYDELGRVVEVGEAILPMGNTFADLEDANSNPIDDPIGDLTQQTYTFFTVPKQDVNYFGQAQRYLQNRVSFVHTINQNGNDAMTYYSYDPHGNVEWLIQDIPELGRTTLEYDYDLISGNVKEVIFNKGRSDQYRHRYAYDEDNRIVSVRTSKDGHIWDEDAAYNYYLHGPLARVEYGEDDVQGLDYIYTIHGWLKAINTPDLVDEDSDGTHAGFAPDEFSMLLTYYEGDFTRDIYSNAYQSSSVNPFHLTNGRNLYNGNITTWTSNIAQMAKDEEEELAGLRANTYTYDRLNRIRTSGHNTYDVDNNTFASTDAYGTAYTFDANGNLLSLERRAEDGRVFDDLSYTYYDLDEQGLQGSNRLRRVNDGITDNSDVLEQLEDIRDQQATDNYIYDEIGNLTRDEQEGITIRWNVQGKVTEIIPDFKEDSTEQRPHMLFTYDAMGNRIMKEVRRFPYDRLGNFKSDITNPELIKTTYYSVDATGNTLGIYERSDTIIDSRRVPGTAGDITANVKYDFINPSGVECGQEIKEHNDGVVDYGTPINWVVPDAVPVTLGNAANKSLFIRYHILGDPTLYELEYIGGETHNILYNCATGNLLGGRDLNAALSYNYSSCTNCTDPVAAGDVIDDVIYLEVHVADGDRSDRSTGNDGLRQTAVGYTVEVEEEEHLYEARFAIVERLIYGSDRIGEYRERQVVSTDQFVLEDYEQVCFNPEELKNTYALNNVLLASESTTTLNDANGDPVEEVMLTDVNVAVINSDDFAALNYSVLSSFEGATANNVAVAENRQGLAQFFAVSADYYGSDNTLLLYNTSGDLIQGSENIFSDKAAKNVVVEDPVQDDVFYLFTRATDGSLSWHKIDMNLVGYGTGGEITSANNQVTAANAGRHLAVIQDETNEVSYVYYTEHNSTFNVSTMHRVSIAASGVSAPESLLTYNSFDEHGNGELKVSPQGKTISVYNHHEYLGWFDHQEAEIMAWKLDVDYKPIAVENTSYAFTGGNTGNGTHARDAADCNLYYQQRSLANLEGENTNIAVYRKHDEAAMTDTISRGLEGDLRLNAKDSLYQFVAGTASGNQWETGNLFTGNLDPVITTVSGTLTAAQSYQNFTAVDHEGRALEGVFARVVDEKVYELKDHLGNVRVLTGDRKLFDADPNTTHENTAEVLAYYNYYPYGMLMQSTVDLEQEFMATFEQYPARKDQEEEDFDESYTASEAFMEFFYALDHTHTLNAPEDAGEDPARLLRMDELSPDLMAKTIEVKEGDELNLQVFGKQKDQAPERPETEGLPVDPGIVVGVILENTTGLPLSEGIKLTFDKIKPLFKLLATTAQGNGNNQARPGEATPLAYINYELTDKDGNVIDSGSEPITLVEDDGSSVDGNNRSTIPHVATNRTVNVTEDGNMRIWLSRGADGSNGQPQDVYVDDYSIQHMTKLLREQRGYRYGFNGMERDDEVKGKGNSYDFGLRVYDSRIGRMLSIDPKSSKYPWQTSYSYHRNNPVNMIDFLGGGDPPDDNPDEVVFTRNGEAIEGVKAFRFTGAKMTPFIREEGTLSSTGISQDKANSTELTINAQFLGIGIFGGYNEGITIIGGKEVDGESQPGWYYIAQDKEGKFSFGKGDPTPEMFNAVGGARPLLIDGLAFGIGNKYTDDAPDELKAKTTGPVAPEDMKYLIQKNMAYFPSQNHPRKGKTIVAQNPTSGEIMIIVQQDGAHGYSLDAYRNYLLKNGFTNALSYDGSDSALLIKDKSVLIKNGESKDKNISSGITFSIPAEED